MSNASTDDHVTALTKISPEQQQQQLAAVCDGSVLPRVSSHDHMADTNIGNNDNIVLPEHLLPTNEGLISAAPTCQPHSAGNTYSHPIDACPAIGNIQQNNNNDTKNLQLAARHYEGCGDVKQPHEQICGDCPALCVDVAVPAAASPRRYLSDSSCKPLPAEDIRKPVVSSYHEHKSPVTSVPTSVLVNHSTVAERRTNSPNCYDDSTGRKPDHISQSLSTTTPKKRHRLEAEMRTNNLIVNGTTSYDYNVPSAHETDAINVSPQPILPKVKSDSAPCSPTKFTRSGRGRDSPKENNAIEVTRSERIRLPRVAKAASDSLPNSRTSSPTKMTRTAELASERVVTRKSKSPSVSPTSSPAKRRCESRASTVSTRSRCDSKPGTPDLIADTNVSPDSIAQDIIITDGILESAKRRMDLLECKVDLYPVVNTTLLSQNCATGDSKTTDDIVTPMESSGTHSDSDIPSEHEPLRESDQSGFMSDKEEPKEALKERASPPQKRLKKKRELRSPKHISLPKENLENPEIDEDDKHNPPPPSKKKFKKRKPNRTGFPTVKRKKKPSRVVTDEEVEGSAADCLPKEEVDNEKITNPDKLAEEGESSQCDEDTTAEAPSVVPDVKPRMRGRPRKVVTEIPDVAREDVPSPGSRPRACKIRDTQDPLPSEPMPSNDMKPTEYVSNPSILQSEDAPHADDPSNIVATATKFDTNPCDTLARAVVSRGEVLPVAGGRTRRKRELILAELSNPTLKRRRKLLPPQRDHRHQATMDACGVVAAAFNLQLRHPLSSPFPEMLAPSDVTEPEVGTDAGTNSSTDAGTASSTDAGTAAGAVSSEPASSDESTRPIHTKRRIPRWKKKYLVAGLFSDYYKQDE